MRYEYLTIPNIVFCIGLLILLVANCFLLMSFLKRSFEGLGFVLLWYFTMIFAGFPLLWLYFRKYPLTTNNPKPKIVGWLIVLLINVVFIGQWLIWRFLLKMIL